MQPSLLIFAIAANLATTIASKADLPEKTQTPWPGFVVIELFTSQGCPSCPPADKMLEQVKNKGQEKGAPIYTLAFHVDYWNRRGWHDRFSHRDYSRRQQSYSSHFSKRQIYTPQIVINGRVETHGANAQKASASIDYFLSQPSGLKINLDVQRDKTGNHLIVNYSTPNAPANSVINLALVDGVHKTHVRRNANRSYTLRNANIVRAFKTFKITKTDDEHSYRLLIPNDLIVSQATVIAYIQDRLTMSVLSAIAAPIPAAGEGQGNPKPLSPEPPSTSNATN